MANFLDKFKIRTAWEGRSHTKDLSCEHITTSDFMMLQPVYYHHFVPKEKLSVDMRAFSRMASMPVPTFGRANLNVRAFFVPYRTVFPAWNDFITDAIHRFTDVTSIPESVPYIQNGTLVTFFINLSSVVSDPSSASDFTFVNEGSSVRYKFSNRGRQLFKIFESLGYHVCFNIQSGDLKYSALPFLAYCKIYCDWYFPSAYVGNYYYNQIARHFTDDVSDKKLTAADLSLLSTSIYYTNYDSDYFVSAFDEPSGPALSEASSVNIPDINFKDGSGVESTSTVTSDIYANTPVTNNVNGTISQYAIEALHRLTDYMKRHQLSGARSLDRYLARFGVQLPAEKLNRSLYLGSHKIPMMTGDVMSTSDTMGTSGAHIGDYAGKGFLVGDDGHFEFQSDEYGIFIICASIVPEVGYFQGVDRHVLNLSRLSFFTPEFDGMGTRAISKNELYLSMNGTADDVRNTTEIFGFTPQYSEYKCGRDFLTGDYRLGTLNAAGETAQAWHLFRDVSDYGSPVHSSGFVNGAQSAPQYDRIFNNTSNDADHFYLHYFFGVKSTSKMLPLYDEYDFHNEAGNEKVMDVNGVKMN